MLTDLLGGLVGLIDTLGYLGIFILMVIESSFIPFPSEIVVPPAAYLAYQGEMNIFLVILSAVAGSMVGALVNYFLAMWLGRPVVYALVRRPWAKFLLLSEPKVEKAEKYFLEYGNLSTFIGRLLPGIRQLISLPAGFVRMPIRSFLFYTFLGASVWVVILALQGYLVGAYQAWFEKYLGLIIVGLIVLAVMIFFIFHFKKKKDF